MTSFELVVIRFMSLISFSIVFKEDKTAESALLSLARDCNAILEEESKKGRNNED